MKSQNHGFGSNRGSYETLYFKRVGLRFQTALTLNSKSSICILLLVKLLICDCVRENVIPAANYKDEVIDVSMPGVRPTQVRAFLSLLYFKTGNALFKGKF